VNHAERDIRKSFTIAHAVISNNVLKGVYKYPHKMEHSLRALYIFPRIQGTRSYTEEFNVSRLITELHIHVYAGPTGRAV
jgi:hypothetical protein